MTQSNPHLPNSEQIDAYIIGGLSADEREAFEAHLNDCQACAAALASAREVDVALRNLLRDARPPAGFEDRVIQGTRRQAQRRLFMAPGIRRAAVAAAAILATSGVGYVGNHILSDYISSAVSNGHAVALSPGRLNMGGGSVQVDRASSTPAWDYGGGSSTAHSWANGSATSTGKNLSYSYENPGVNTGVIAGGWKLNTSFPSDYAVASDINPGLVAPTPAFAASDGRPVNRQSSPGAVAFSFKPTELAWSVTALTGLPGIGVTEKGNGSLALGGVNTYTGLTTINGGTLVAGGAISLDRKLSTSNDVSEVEQLLAQGPGAAPAESDHPKPNTNSAVPSTPLQAPAPVVDSRKVIRNGAMEFEVDSFDAALAQITKITNESGGFVSTTDSDKLPNGKVKGTVTLRVSPERLDVLVLSLRALGDLKSQQIKAEDVGKQYNDEESALAAAKAMESRLLELIKSGNGQIKDLLAAEKELGVWREKIEQAEGEIRFYNSQIAMSTLSITLYERNIKTVAAVTEIETADAGVETEDVEMARTDALKSIDDAKGRVVEAELKRFDAGQLAARIVADVPPESIGSLIDRLKQIGRISRLEIHRQQSATDGSDPTTAAAPLRIERKPTRLVVSLYNLANVAPRRTTNITLAANDVETAYAALVSQAKSIGGRVVTSSLDRADANQIGGSVVFEIPPDKMDAASNAIAAQGELLKRAVTENPDTQNTTDSKQGFTVQLVSLASVQPRETIQQLLAAADVSATYHTVLDSANAAHARIHTAQLNEQDRQNVIGTLEFEVLRAQLGGVSKSIDGGGQIIAREVGRADDAQNTVDSKVAVRLTIRQADRLPPRETTTMEIQVGDAAKAAGDAEAAVMAAGGEVVDSSVNKDRAGRETAKVVLSAPLGSSSELLGQLRSSGVVRSVDSARDPQAPAGPAARARIELTLATSDAIVDNDSGLLSTIRNGLATSVAGLLWSVRLLVIGLCLVGPWVVIAWIASRLWRRARRRDSAA